MSPSPSPRAAARTRLLAAACWIGCAAVLVVISVMTVIRIGRDVPVSAEGPTNAMQGPVLRPQTGDFQFYFEGAQALRLGQNPYAFASRTYPNPPLVAALMGPLVSLGERAAAYVWLPINVGLLALSALLAGREVVRRLNIRADVALLPAVVLLGLLLTLDQCRWTIVRGNVDTLLLLPVVLGLMWLDRRPLLAGLVLGFANNIKYLTLAFVPYAAARGRWRAAASMVASTVGWAMLPALVLGWERNLQLVGWAFAGLPRLVGVSVDDAQAAPTGAMASRRAGVSITQSILKATANHEWPPLLGAALVATALAAVALVAWRMYAQAGEALWGRRLLRSDHPDQARMGLLEWSGTIALMLAFSPHTEVRHTVLLVPVHIGIAALLLCKGGVARWPLLVACGASQAAIRLPTGGASVAALDFWRSTGGPTVFIVVTWLAMLWTGLRFRPAHGPAAGEP